MEKDPIDEILEQWSDERPDLDTASLGVVIRVMTLYRSFRRQADRALRRQGEPYTLPATRLARETELSSGAMTNRIDRLESRGLVKRKPDRKDRRGVNVSLTASGRRLIDKAIQHRLDSARESLRDLSAAQQRELARLLRIAVLAAPEPD